MNENDIQHILKRDANLREAINRREQQLPPMPADLNERVMGKMETPTRQHHTYSKWLAAAACLLLVIGIGTMLLTKKQRPGEKPMAVNTVPATPQGQPAQAPQDMDTEAMDSRPVAAPSGASVTPIVATDSKKDAKSQERQPVIAATTPSGGTDSLQYYIDIIERELAVVGDSLYIDRMNQVIRADERLQRIVSSYILHTLDEQNRPQTADNMLNLNNQENEDK